MVITICAILWEIPHEVRRNFYNLFHCFITWYGGLCGCTFDMEYQAVPTFKIKRPGRTTVNKKREEKF